jgi:hypothetical protein
MIYTWLVESLFLLLVVLYVAAILAMTARRARVAPATLAVGTGAGLVLGAAMYLIAPLGLTSDATSPWLHGRATDPLVVLAWILLFGAPLTAAGLAVLRSRLPRGALARLREGLAAGFLATGVGALLVTMAGTVTVALLPQPGRTLRWPNPGLHQLAAVARSAEVTASIRTDGYGLILLAFPVIGLIMGTLPYLHSLDDGQAHHPPPDPAS